MCPFFPIQYVGVSYNHFFCHAKACRNKCPTKPATINANIRCRCVRRLQTPGSGYYTFSTLGALHLRLLHCTTSATSACNLHTGPSEDRGVMSLVRRHHLQGTTMFVGVSCKSFQYHLRSEAKRYCGNSISLRCLTIVNWQRETGDENEELSYSVDHNQKLLAGVVNCGCTDHPTKHSVPRLHLYQLNFHCKQLWLLFHLSCVHSAVLYIPDSTVTRAYIKMQEPRLSRTLHAPAVHTGTPACL